MGIDSSIALQGKLPQFDNPLASLAQVSAIRNAQQQNRLADMMYGEKQREIEQSNALGEQYKNALAPDGTMDRNKLYTGLAGAGLGAKLPGIQKGYADSDKSAVEAEKAKYETTMKKFEVAGQIMAPVKDQASWEVARQQTAQLFGAEVAAQMPAQYDPALVEQKRMQALAVKEQLDQKWKAADFSLNKDKFAYQQTNDAATRGVTMRGQDMSQGTAIRGQDLTNSRALEMLDTKVEENKLKRQEAGNKPLTESQGKATGFAARAQEADKLIAGLEGKYSPSAINSKAAVEGTPLIGGLLGAGVNKMALSTSDRQAEQAQRDFINAVLRQESGAAIGASEFDSARKQYFTQPGEEKDPIAVAQKARNRRLAVEALKSSAGPGADKIGGMVDRSQIDLTKVRPGTPEFKAVMADADQIGRLRTQSKPAAKPSLDDIFGK